MYMKLTCWRLSYCLKISYYYFMGSGLIARGEPLLYLCIIYSKLFPLIYRLLWHCSKRRVQVMWSYLGLTVAYWLKRAFTAGHLMILPKTQKLIHLRFCWFQYFSSTTDHWPITTCNSYLGISYSHYPEKMRGLFPHIMTEISSRKYVCSGREIWWSDDLDMHLIPWEVPSKYPDKRLFCSRT